MKKLYSTKKYKRINTVRSKRVERNSRKRNKYNPNRKRAAVYSNGKTEYIQKSPIEAPAKLELLNQTEGCLEFFKKIRSEKAINKSGRFCFVKMDLTNVVDIDYSTVCVLLAILGDMKAKGVYVYCTYPKDKKCKQQIIDAGLLEVMYDKQGDKFQKVATSDLLFIEKGQKKLTKEDNKRISETVKNVVEHLTAERIHCRQLRRVLLEICGNSIEWAGTQKRQWLFGVKYEKDQAIFTITDVGKGILNSLHKKFGQTISDFLFNSDVEVLKGAFQKKYGSSSKKANRNKGLPSIKEAYDDGVIKNLKVLTNNVIMHFDDDKKSAQFPNKLGFNGTLYRWTVNKQCLEKYYENN
jgi:hypothetical protein